MKRRLSGVIPPIGTPLGDGDRVDETALRRLTRYLLDAGVHGILANGTMGGFAFLTDEEQLHAIATVIEEVNGTVPVMGGLGETSTSRAVRKAKRIAQEGISYLSVLPPFYFHATQEHLLAYFSEIAAAVDCPIFLYDNPALTKNPLHPETVAELRRRIPTILGIKVSNEDLINLQTLLELMAGDEGFSILTGSEFLIVVALQMGCAGFVGGLHNLCPHLALALYTAFQAGDLKRARQLQQDLIGTWQIFKYGNIWGAFDEALRYLHLADRAAGAPYISKLTTEEVIKVHSILDQYVKPYLDFPKRLKSQTP
ncbi:MAG TPA: dihydrodipicolinate synthase family protein [Terriglobia bacterium]|nr:dihydrodipicolinate synthase family protein [Terriglobia bacterium]